MALKEQSCFTEAHFCVLPTQSNVYGMCNYTSASTVSRINREKVLVACLNGDITLFQYVVSEENELKPVNKQFRLQYISGKMEIVSMDSFTKVEKRTGQHMIVLAITFVEQSCGFTSILTAPLRSGEHFYENLSLATEKGIPVEMAGVPCQVTHAKIFKHGTFGKVFLVTTTCNRVHLFKECSERISNKKHLGMSYRETNVNKYFPELAGELEDSLFFLDILYYDDNKRRLTCTGSQGGKVNFYEVDVPNNNVLRRYQAMGFGPVTSVVMFTDEPDVPIPDYLLKLYDGERKDQPVVHALVSHALEVASVYRDVMKNGLTQQITLENSYNYDSVLCACVADVDFDGMNEIILGTYGQKILAYKFDSEAPASQATRLLWEHSLQYPIHSVMPLDLTGDGVKDLAVLSMRGLHILQKDISKAATFISERFYDLDLCFQKLDVAADSGVVKEHTIDEEKELDEKEWGKTLS